MSQLIRFGPFEANLRTGELRKGETPIRVSEQPFQILAALLEKPGELVTREELKDKLWPEETFVEFDDSLNTAVNKLRQALGDSARNPKYIETLQGRGYRFVGSSDQAVASGSAAAAQSKPDSPPTSMGRREKVVWAVAAAFAVVAAWALLQGPAPAPERVTRFELSLPEGQEIPGLTEDVIALSPDGRTLAYTATENGGETAVYLWPFGSFEPRKLGVSGRTHSPFFSPDGEWIGFQSESGLSKIPTQGGPAVEIADSHAWTTFWGRDNHILFANGSPSEIWQVSASGGEPELLSTGYESAEGSYHFSPTLLPGGEQMLFVAMSDGGGEINLLDLASGRRRIVKKGVEGWGVYYSPSGHIVYGDDRSVLAAPFDLGTGEITGPALVVAEGVYRDVNEATSDFAVSASGALAYVVGESARRDLVWVDRTRRIEALPLPQEQYGFGVQLSPDETKVAVGKVEGRARHIWVYDIGRGSGIPLTSDGRNRMPIWSPDGDRVAFSSEFLGKEVIRWSPADGSAPPSEWAIRNRRPWSGAWTGDTLLFREPSPGTGSDIWMLQGDSEPKALIRTEASEDQHAVSPQGKWIAYVADKSGRNEIYVQAFPHLGALYPISNNGGNFPRWSRDSRELFYLEGDRMMAVSIKAGATLEAGRPRELFKWPYTIRASYDVASDGRFLMVRELETAPVTKIRVDLNWFERFSEER